METAISVDWSEDCDKYNNLGRNVLLNSCKHEDGGANDNGYCEKCSIASDDALPMMNYLYPVYRRYNGYSEDKILRVVRKTNCTLVEETSSGDLFLTLCGGGMDLSQDIALAYYLLAEGPYNMIPVDILRSMCLQPGLSIGLKDFVKVTKQGVKEVKNDIGHLQSKLKEMKAANKAARLLLKERRDKHE